jgi:hypothetical protein
MATTKIPRLVFLTIRIGELVLDGRDLVVAIAGKGFMFQPLGSTNSPTAKE